MDESVRKKVQFVRDEPHGSFGGSQVFKAENKKDAKAFLSQCSCAPGFTIEVETPKGCFWRGVDKKIYKRKS